jgi:predicted TPR repeat methyltransferase
MNEQGTNEAQASGVDTSPAYTDDAQAAAAFKQAVALHQQGDIAAAAALYEKILEAQPQQLHALHLLGVIKSQQGQHFLARRLMESSLAITEDADVLANLAQVLLQLGLHQAASTRCEAALAVNPGNARCHLTQGKALRFLGRFEAAVESLNRALHLQPGLTEALVHRGFCLHSLKRLDDALSTYDQALAQRPASAAVQAELLSNRGHALFALDRQAEAVSSLEQALVLSPNMPDAHYHRGLTQVQERQWQAALASFGRACELERGYAQALERMAYVMHKLKIPPQDCLAVLDQSLLAAPNAVPALLARAALLSRLRIYGDALADYDQALLLEPRNAKSHTERGEVLLQMKRTGEAVQAFQTALECGGDADELRYALASLGNNETPSSAPPRYVVNLFDWYAEHFDKHLQGRLKYQTPALLHEQIAALLPQGQGATLTVLDLGCGTGLCGPLLKPWSRHLAGVDLSPKMLEMAGQRGLYDQLACADLTAFVAQQAASSVDLVVATDVFIYVGALEAVFAATQHAMRAGGLFAFSLEISEDADLVLRPTRRYAHSVSYIERLAAQHGFAVATLEPSVIREEGGQAQNGFLVVLRAV